MHIISHMLRHGDICCNDSRRAPVVYGSDCRPHGGEIEGSIPDALVFFFVVSDSNRGKRENVSKQRIQLRLFVVS